jgi:hypothetical protein
MTIESYSRAEVEFTTDLPSHSHQTLERAHIAVVARIVPASLANYDVTLHPELALRANTEPPSFA